MRNIITIAFLQSQCENYKPGIVCMGDYAGESVMNCRNIKKHYQNGGDDCMNCSNWNLRNALIQEAIETKQIFSGQGLDTNLEEHLGYEEI